MNPDDLYPQGVGLSWQEDSDQLEERIRANLRAREEAEEGGSTESPEGEGKSLTEKVKDQGKAKFATPFGMMGIDSQGAQAIKEGLKKTWNNTSNGIINLAQGAGRLYARMFKDEDDREWAAWYSKSAADINPLAFEVDENPGGVYGFIEGTTQFATIFMPATGALKAAGMVGTAAKANFVRAGLAGAAADFFGFDPKEARGADLIQAGERKLSEMLVGSPDHIRDPITAFLAAKGNEDDSELLGRVKLAMDGFLLGTTIEGLLYGLRVLKKAKGKTNAEIDKAIEEVEVEGPMFGPEEEPPFTIREREDGIVEVIPTERGAKYLAEEAAAGPRKFYRGTVAAGAEGAEKRIPNIYGEVGEGKTFMARKKDSAKMYGDQIEEITAKPEAKILDEGSPEYVELTGRNSDDILKTLKEDENAAQAVQDVMERAQDAGYDAVSFNRDSDIGSVILNEDAFERAAKDTSIKTAAQRRAAKEAPEELPEGVIGRYTQRGRAENIAAALNVMTEDRIAFGKGPREFKMSEQASGALRTVFKRMSSIASDQWDPRILEGIQLNGLRIGAGHDVRQMLNAVADVLQDGFNEVAKNTRDIHKSWVNNYVTKSGVPQKATVKAAKRLIHGVKVDDFIARMTELAGETRNVHTMITAARILLIAQGKHAADISRLFEIDPTNPFLARMWGETADRMASLALSVRAVSADLGRGLNALKIEVTPEMAKGAGKGAGKSKPKWKHPFSDMTKESDAELTRTGKKKGETPKGPKDRPEPVEGELVTNPVTRWMKDQRPSHRQLRAMARALRWTEGDPEAVLRAMRLTIRKASTDRMIHRTFMDRVIGFRAAMMLYGPRTMAVNLVSSALAAGQIPLEIAMGGVLIKDKATMKFGLDMLASPFTSEGATIVKQAMKQAKRSFMTMDSQLDATFVKDDLGSLEKLTGPMETMGWFQKFLSGSSRALLFGDELIKQIAYMSHVRAQSLADMAEESAEWGFTRTRAEKADRIYEDLMQSYEGINPYTNKSEAMAGGFTNPNAMAHARQATFTDALQPGTFGKVLQDAANSNAAVRFIFPFVRTPVNIYRYAWHRTPLLNQLSSDFRSAMKSSDPGVRAQAKGKTAMGLMVYSAAAMAANFESLTGKGPDNNTLRSQLLDAKWQPYSVKVGGKWVSYRRMEPLATPIALIADYNNAMGELKNEAEAEEVMMAFLAAMSHSVSSKTFLVGAANFFDAIGSGKAHAVEAAITSAITSFTPSFMRQTQIAPYWQEANGVFQNVARNLWYFNAQLEPRRNMFGEVVMKPPNYLNRNFNPFTVIAADQIDDTLFELVQLGKSIPMPQETWGEINLRDRTKWINKNPERKDQSPYDRMMELMQKLQVRKQVEALTKSPGWVKVGTGTDLYPGGMKHQMVSSMVQQNAETARQMMLAEYPELAKAVIFGKVDRTLAPMGQDRPMAHIFK